MKQQPNPRNALTLERRELDPGALSKQLLRHAKKRARWQVGLEYELIAYTRDSLQRIDQECVQSIMRAFAAQAGAAPVLEQNQIVSVALPDGSITLEPGGQLEFSGPPTSTIAETEARLRGFLVTLRKFGDDRDVVFAALGFDPLRTLDEQHWIRKQRYAIMKPYLLTRGGHAWNMMARTASIQVSIDYGDERDLGRKYVLGNRAGPYIAAMFANSPFADGRLTGLKSTRYAAWLDTDPDRAGAGPGSLDASFDLQRYVEEVLQVPLFFIERNGALQNVAGTKLQDIPDARVEDFENLLSMIFSEARIRQYVEMRSADSGAPEYALALIALWKGLTYHADTLLAALEATPVLEQPAYRALQMAVAKEALAARCEGVDVLAVAQRLLELGRHGLTVVAPQELHYLDPLMQNICEDGVSPADLLIKNHSRSAQAALLSSVVA